MMFDYFYDLGQADTIHCSRAGAEAGRGSVTVCLQDCCKQWQGHAMKIWMVFATKGNNFPQLEPLGSHLQLQHRLGM